ncbi:MAG TPA: hypothetical protein VFG68_19585 [Fimbriiglobus sp.]|nr:hypothetical protein [Fimbriiglobus sp.]
MLPTYPAVIRDGRIEWTGEAPVGLPPDTAVPCYITLFVPAPVMSREERGKRMAAALERLAARGGVASIPDPLAWEREQREDRPLPGRE